MKQYSTCKTFVAEQTEELWERLEKWQNCVETKTTRETYYKICEQLGQDPDPDRIPPEIDDFPNDVQLAMAIHSKLGDKVVADIGYMGKDLTSLPLHMRLSDISNEEIFLETILRLDERIIKKGQEEMKRARDKLKHK